MTGLAALAAVFVVYALIASRLDSLSITSAMVFVAAGLVLGPSATGSLPHALDGETGKIIVELTLAILLFADASTVRLREAEADVRLPSQLLFIGLPLTIAVGAILAKLLYPDAGWAAAALVATILAPTDAALGLAVFTNPAVPVRIRRALNPRRTGPWRRRRRSALPSLRPSSWARWGDGFLCGPTAVGGHRRSPNSSPSSRSLCSLMAGRWPSAATDSWQPSSGAFCSARRRHGRCTGRSSSPRPSGCSPFFVWALFGALLAGPLLTHHLEPVAILYAVLSLTVARMLPVAIALVGSHLRPDTVAFIGWFGPRGLASVVFTLIAVESLNGAGVGPDTLTEVAVWTILFSVVAHGLSAGPDCRQRSVSVKGGHAGRIDRGAASNDCSSILDLVGLSSANAGDG